MSGSHLSTMSEPSAAWNSAPSQRRFSAEDFARIASGYENRTGWTAWVGYGFTAPDAGGLARVFLISEDGPGARFILTQPSPDFYEILAPDGNLLWSGFGLDNLLEAFAPKGSTDLSRARPR